MKCFDEMGMESNQLNQWTQPMAQQQPKQTQTNQLISLHVFIAPQTQSIQSNQIQSVEWIWWDEWWVCLSFLKFVNVLIKCCYIISSD